MTVHERLVLEHLSANALLSVQAAYLLVPVEQRAQAFCERLDEISAEVARRNSPPTSPAEAIASMILGCLPEVTDAWEPLPEPPASLDALLDHIHEREPEA